MSAKPITAIEIKPDMTLVIDGQHHIVEDVAQHEDGGRVFVGAETVIGDMGHRDFAFEPGDAVMVLSESV